MDIEKEVNQTARETVLPCHRDAEHPDCSGGKKSPSGKFWDWLEETGVVSLEKIMGILSAQDSLGKTMAAQIRPRPRKSVKAEDFKLDNTVKVNTTRISDAPQKSSKPAGWNRTDGLCHRVSEASR